ncbi:hypothetical protein PR003_g26551 [Phytophthora rubi]|uniref:Uncharacterized protein n=1 Tax=Phytophthora rubi TaxID=129364 RepID=A0A6A3IHW4_9STRA|nr:hypothetical protein PR002_g23488 [Phytophthora rubi]KAE8984406.1 hypothetical protein PR001_g23187 [Phytophthora rubi]KAE9285549.1 hypothetical protein PR003_g26551 [Phytophthora rubi]
MLASPLCMFLSGKAHALSEHALRGLREKGEGGAELSKVGYGGGVLRLRWLDMRAAKLN